MAGEVSGPTGQQGPEFRVGQGERCREPVSDVFVADPGELQRTFGIEYRRLRNGIQIVGTPRQTRDSVDASLKIVSRNGGGFFDPPHLFGLSHFAEHFINKSTIPYINRFGLDDLRATTTPTYMQHILKGATNSHSLRYGVWDALPLIRRALEDPIGQLPPGEENALYHGEQQAVIAEIVKRSTDQNVLVNQFTAPYIYAPTNPYSKGEEAEEGTIETVSQITLPDLAKRSRELFIPDGMVLSAFADGSQQDIQHLVARLEELYGDFPRANQHSQSIPWEEAGQLNADFIPGAMFRIPTGIPNNTISYLLSWPIERGLFDTRYFAARQMAEIVKTKLREVQRRNSWGYSHNASISENSAGTHAIFQMRVDLPKKVKGSTFTVDPDTFIEEFTRGAREKVLGGISYGDIIAYDQMQRLRDQSVPPSLSNIHGWLMDGLLNWGTMIDYRKIKAIRSTLTVADLITVRDQLLDQPPVAMLVGDL